MQLNIKNLVMLVLLTQLLSSCYSSRRINKEDEPITGSFLSQIEPGKRYEFKLKTGQTQTIYVTSVDDQTITGYLVKRTKGKVIKSNYSASFSSIKENVSKISVQKFNPILTTATIVVPVTLFVIFVSEAWQNISVNF